MDSVYLQESLKAEKKVFRNHQKHKSTKHVMLGSHFKELESQYYNYQELPITWIRLEVGYPTDPPGKSPSLLIDTLTLVLWDPEKVT